MPDALEELGCALASLGDGERAARVLGAAQSSRDATGLVRPPPVAESYERDATPARTSHRDAWAEGASMSLEDAAAYALRGRGRRRRASIGWDWVTPSEMAVVRLAADGLTNPDIGARLFVSRRTVQNHLSSVYTKLGVASRAELAAAYVRRGG